MKKIIVLFILISSILTSHLVESRTLKSVSYSSLKETIIALDYTRTKSEKEIENLSALASSSYKNNQIKEYGVFIEYLTYQINEYCNQISRQYGQEKIYDLPCDGVYGNSSTENMAMQKQLKTTDERTGELEDEFMASLGEFDEMLLKEEEELAQTSRKKQSANGSGSGAKLDSGSTKGKGSSQQGEKDTDSSGKYSSKNDQEQQKKGEFKNSNTQSKNSNSKSSGEGQGKAYKKQTGNANKTS